MALTAPGAYASPRRPAGLPAPAPVKVVTTLHDATTTATIVMRRHQRIIEDCFNLEYFKMGKTALPSPSAGSSGNPHRQKPGPKPKYSQQQSSSAPSSSTLPEPKLPLPQCKVKRNYACSKCPYYTQNPRSFLHHQKNVHSERLKVYECSHCLYASKHSQKLQRHVHMVHQTDSKSNKKHDGFDESGKPLLVPPVRIRVQRFEKFTDQHVAKLVIVEDVDVEEVHPISAEEEGDEEAEADMEAEAEAEAEAEVEEEAEEEAEEEEDELDDEEAVEEEEQEDEDEEDEQGDDDDDGSVEADDRVPVVSLPQTESPTSPLSLPPQQSQQKKYKLDKPSVTFIRCSVCPFGSHSRTLVNRHEKSAHLKKKFFRCMKCNYVTHMRARYTKHVKYHTMPMIKCDDCDFRTPYKWNLDRHNRNHSIISPGTYKCSHCSFSADIKQSLTVHETNHHVPPVGGVFPANGSNRRRYRVGASDAPGSAVDGTEIVTYETTKEGGVVEFMTETKSTAPSVSSSSGGGSTSKAVASKIGGTCTVVKKTTTTTTTSSLSPMPIKVISVTSPPEGSTKAVEQKQPARRRPMPKLIPIVEQSRLVPSIVRMRLPVTTPPPPSENSTAITADDYYSLAAGQSALSDFASIIDDTDCASGPFNCGPAFANTTASGTTTADRRRSSSSTGSSSTITSPKSKTASFFDKLKAKVDETADLTCSVCRYESKCLSEFMRHQRTHGDDERDAATAAVDIKGLKTEDHTVTTQERTTSTPPPPPPPPPPVTAAELKSTRCQRCRKRCKTSTELILHLATCRGTTAAATITAAAAIDSPSQPAAVKETVTDEDQDMQQHPMENKIFVWNTSVVATPPGEDHAAEDDDDDDELEERDSVTLSEIMMPPDVEPPSVEDESEDDINETPDNTNSCSADMLKHQEQLKHAIRKEGKMYKTVFKCPHCTFWAATASRFHVHIVGHLNRKPFECSCCAYRSNWRWDITKHIRLKSAKRGGGEETASPCNSHQGAKVLMTDETGRRNYSKYNRYLTVMEMDISDGADKAAGGECEDGKGVRKSVGGGITRKRRAPAFAHNNGAALLLKQHQTSSSSGKAATAAGQLKRFKAAAIRNQQLNQQQNQNNSDSTTLLPPSASGGDGRSKTVWKCKKCFFRDCDRLTVLNHVKAHYRRGEFGSNTGATRMNSSQHGDAVATTALDATNATINELYIQTKKSSGIKEKAEQNSPTTDRRKMKIPTTGTTSDKLLLLSTNPKSLMLYDDENFLSCPLCDVTAASPGQLKEHMQCTHIPEETKYRCEYCPFWSEEKKAMLDHMMFAHEMDDGSVSTDVNATEANYGTEQRDESASNSINDDDDEGMQGIDEHGSSDDVTANMTMFDNGSDDTNTTTNMEVMFDNTDENIVVVEAVECKPDFVDNDGGSTIETPSTPSKSSEKSSYSSNAADDKIANNMVSCEYDGGEERDEDEEIIVRAEEVTKPTSVKIIKEILAPTTSTVSEGDATTVSHTEIEVFECNECWYYSTNRRDLLAHKQLHVERGALYNCTECVFNVTKSAILYHHYRHGHVIEEPELRYPEDSVVRAGQRDMNAKNADEKLENKTTTGTDVEETTAGPPMVWHYRKENVPPFTKVFKCRYCPHTNRRRHNTVEHERMHSDHPDHQNHRQMQQRLSGCSVPPSPLHPCKRCTYVCNNAGVLASHVKVHSTSYSCSTVGFYDVTVVDTIQIQALEYVMELEHSLLLDKHTAINSGISHSGNEVLSDTSSDNESQEDVTKYTEIDEPELKFCPYCPARYFFITDLRFHIRFHRFRGWKNACECCSFVARAKSHVDAHEIVHCDEYAQRTTELIASGYPVNPKYPQPSEYPASVSGGSPPQLQRRPWSPPELPNYNDSKTLSPEPDGQRQRRTKRMRYSEPNVATTVQPPPIEYADDTSKRRRRSMVVGVAMKTASVKPPPPALLPVLKTTTSKSTPPPLLPAPNIPVANAINTTSVATIKLEPEKSIADAPVKPIKNTKASYIRQFMCTMCPGKFFKSTALQYHKTLHSGPGRYRCRRCDYAVSTYGNLVRHETVHRDLPAREKVKTKTSKKLRALSKLKAKGKKIPLPVILSEKPATSSSQPENATDNNDGQEEFQIDPEFGSAMLGNPNFFYATTVKNGVIRTKRYKCPKCPSAFDKRDQFAVHLTLHGARDKYQCDKCDYSVRYTANYVQHQRKHAQDAEIRKNNAQAADRAKMIKEQEEASNAQRIRRRPTAEDRKPQCQTKLMLPPPVKLQPQDTTFTNEISDQQTAYELNAAYGATGNLVGETTTSLFRCAQCPFECDIRSQLDRHTTHHHVAMNSSGAASKRSWKRSCRFCTYRTHGEVDLAEHTRVHFLRSTGEPVPNNSDYSSLETYVPPTDIGETKHIEFHGKRVVYSQRRRNNNTDNQEDVPDNLDEGDIEPFFVFKDCGEFRYRTNDPAIGNGMTTAAMIRSHKRFSPDRPPPHMTIDYNDNRTGDGPKAPPAAFVRFFDSGTRLEFLDDDPAEHTAGAAKRRRSMK